MADEQDYIKGWTAQAGSEPEKPEDVAGYVVTPEQLPDKDALAKAGVDVDQLFAGLVVAVDDEEKAYLRGEDYVADYTPEAPVENPDPEDALTDEPVEDEKPEDEPVEDEKPVEAPVEKPARKPRGKAAAKA